MLLPAYSGNLKRFLYCLGGKGRSASNSRVESVAENDNVSGCLRDVLRVAEKTGSARGSGTCEVLMLSAQADLAGGSLVFVLPGTVLSRVGERKHLRSKESYCQ